jgi:hypothetical protein
MPTPLRVRLHIQSPPARTIFLEKIDKIASIRVLNKNHRWTQINTDENDSLSTFAILSNQNICQVHSCVVPSGIIAPVSLALSRLAPANLASFKFAFSKFA